MPQFPNLQWFPAAGQQGCDVSGHSGVKWQQLCWQCAWCLLLLVAGDADAYPQGLWAQSLVWTSELLWPGNPGDLLFFTICCRWKFLATRAFWEGMEGVPGCWHQLHLELPELKVCPLLLASAVEHCKIQQCHR